MASSDAFNAGSVFRVNTYAWGVEVEQVVPFTHANHAFVVVRTAEDFVDVVFGQTRTHLIQLVKSRECTAVVVEGQGVRFREAWLVCSAFRSDFALSSTGGQQAGSQQDEAHFCDFFHVIILLLILPAELFRRPVSAGSEFAGLPK